MLSGRTTAISSALRRITKAGLTNRDREEQILTQQSGEANLRAFRRLRARTHDRVHNALLYPGFAATRKSEPTPTAANGQVSGIGHLRTPHHSRFRFAGGGASYPARRSYVHRP